MGVCLAVPQVLNQAVRTQPPVMCLGTSLCKQITQSQR